MSAKANSGLASPSRAALYLRVSTGRQAEHDLSIPDQRRQLRSYCEAKGIEVVAEFVEPGASATDDRRPEFQRMMDAASQKPQNVRHDHRPLLFALLPRSVST
jgi:site-specific DNA recombinase